MIDYEWSLPERAGFSTSVSSFFLASEATQRRCYVTIQVVGVDIESVNTDTTTFRFSYGRMATLYTNTSLRLLRVLTFRL